METTIDAIFTECAGTECDALIEGTQTAGRPQTLCNNCKLERKRLRNREQYTKKAEPRKLAKVDSGTNCDSFVFDFA